MQPKDEIMQYKRVYWCTTCKQEVVIITEGNTYVLKQPYLIHKNCGGAKQPYVATPVISVDGVSLTCTGTLVPLLKKKPSTDGAASTAASAATSSSSYPSTATASYLNKKPLPAEKPTAASVAINSAHSSASSSSSYFEEESMVVKKPTAASAAIKSTHTSASVTSSSYLNSEPQFAEQPIAASAAMNSSSSSASASSSASVEKKSGFLDLTSYGKGTQVSEKPSSNQIQAAKKLKLDRKKAKILEQVKNRVATLLEQATRGGWYEQLNTVTLAISLQHEGKIKTGVNKELTSKWHVKEKLWHKLPEKGEYWHSHNCAEVAAVNKFVAEGNDVESVLVYTVNPKEVDMKTGSYKVKPPCENCKEWLTKLEGTPFWFVQFEGEK